MDYFFSKIKYKFSKSKAIIVALFLVLISAICVGSVGSFATAFAEEAQTQNTITVTFNAGDGSFEGETGKTYTRQFTKGKVFEPKYSHTDNINDAGVANGTYANNLSTTDIVTIPGATSIQIDVWYSTEGIRRDWLAIYPKGVTPTSSNYDDATISGGKLGDGKKTTKAEATHKTFYVNDDTAIFYFKSNIINRYYGYYAVVTGRVISTLTDGQEAVKQPTPADGHYFIGWADDANNKYAKDLSDFASDKDVTLYAVYADWTYYWDYTPDNTVNTISLTKYKGTETTYTVPATATIGGKVYSVIYGSGSPKNSTAQVNLGTITNLSFDAGVQFPTNSKNLFYWSKLTSLNLTGVDTNDVTDMYCMFYDCTSLTSLNLSGFNTSNVTNMNSMFEYCNKLTSLDLNSFNTSKVTDMSYMFSNCTSLTDLNLNNFDTSEVTYMSYMFSSCNSLTSLDVSNFDTSNVTDMNSLFEDCNKLATLDLSSFNTSNVTNMIYMFHNCSALTSLDVSNFDMSKVTSYSSMFSNCTPNTIKTPINTNGKTFGNLSLPGGKYTDEKDVNGKLFTISEVVPNSVTLVLAVNSLKSRLSETSLENATEIYFVTKGKTPSGATTKITDVASGSYSKVVAYTNPSAPTIYYITCEDANSPKVIFQNCNYLFADLKKLEKVTFDGSAISYNSFVSASHMFENCSSLTYIDFAGIFDNVIDMSYMFKNCTSFNSTNKLNLYSSNFSTSNAKDLTGMFYGCTGLTSVGTSSSDSLYLSTSFGSYATNISYLFGECKNLTKVNLSSLSFGNVENASYMFSGCTSLAQVGVDANSGVILKSGFGANCTNFEGMFSGCSGLVKANLGNLTTTKAKNMSYMFSDCSSLTKIDLTQLNTSALQDASYMFRYCIGLKSAGVDGTVADADLKKVADTADAVYSLNFGTNFATRGITKYNGMFSGCSMLNYLDISSFDVASGASVDDLLNTGYIKLETIIAQKSGNFGVSASGLGDKKFMYQDNKQVLLGSNNILSQANGASETPARTIILVRIKNFLTKNLGQYITDATFITFSNVTPDGYKVVTDQSGKNIDIGDFIPDSSEKYPNAMIVYKKGTNYIIYCDDQIKLPADMSNLFKVGNASMTTLQKVEFVKERLDDSLVVNASKMFSGCTNLQTVYMAGLKFSNCTNFANMFSGCTSLAEVKMPYNSNLGTLSNLGISSSEDKKFVKSGSALQLKDTASVSAGDVIVTNPVAEAGIDLQFALPIASVSSCVIMAICAFYVCSKRKKSAK